MLGALNHYTSQYIWNCPVFRRGFPIYFYSPFDDNDRINSISVVLRTGRGQSSRSVKEIKITNGYEIDGWTVTYEPGNKKNHIVVIIKSSGYAIIGQYVASIFINERLRNTVKFILFFNPWCKNDSVYLDDEDKRYEYVLNTHTLIFMGTHYAISSRGWYLAQFQSYSIESVLMLLDRLPVNDRCSPIKVSRFFSQMVNANDDNGIVQGNWNGNYRGGVNPMAWNGSNFILSKYAKYKTSVKYGQCWVFCGVLCSVLRTCGIPARCVTTYNSFHDHDGSLAWEMYFNRYMRPVYFRRQETMWNFHCWNEAWMDRNDLTLGYGGWQIVDSTPQERSLGLYRCGPASQLAVKEGNIEMAYDTGFVFAEVNANKIYYFQRPNGRFVVGRVDTHTVGHNISVKAIGVNRREDITHSYKYPDGSSAEKIVHMKIHNKRRRFRDIPPCPVQVKIFYPANTSYRVDCPIYFKMMNNLQTGVYIKFRVLVCSISYRGRVNSYIIDQMYETRIDSTSEKSFQEVVKGNILRNIILRDQSIIKVEINGIVNNEHFLHSEIMFEVESPKISFYGIPDNMAARMRYKIKLSATNPIEKTLTDTKIYLSGDVLVDGRHKILVGLIRPEETFESIVEVYSRTRGEKHIYASLSSNEISGFERHILLNFN